MKYLMILLLNVLYQQCALLEDLEGFKCIKNWCWLGEDSTSVTVQLVGVFSLMLKVISTWRRGRGLLTVICGLNAYCLHQDLPSLLWILTPNRVSEGREEGGDV